MVGKSRRLKEAINVPPGMQHAYNLNTIRDRLVENEIAAGWETAQSWGKVFPGSSKLWPLYQELTYLFNTLSEPLGSLKVVLCDVFPDCVEVRARTG